MPARMKHWLIISHDASFIGFFQTSNDVEQGRFAATAWSDYDDEFSFGDFEGNIVQCVHGLPFLLEPFRDVLDTSLAGGGPCSSSCSDIRDFRSAARDREHH